MKTLITIVGVAALALAGACERIKNVTGRPAPVNKDNSPPRTVETYKVPTKEEYYRLLMSGYRPPRHTLAAGGYDGGGPASPKRPVSEGEGHALKIKYGEGRKYAAAGKGEQPEIPAFLDHDDGTFPPRGWKGDDDR